MTPDEREETSEAARTPYELAQYLATAQYKTFKDMSAIELEDMRIPGARHPLSLP